MASLVRDLLPDEFSSSNLSEWGSIVYGLTVVVALMVALFLTITGTLTPFWVWFAALPLLPACALAALFLCICGLALYFSLVELLIPDLDD